MDGGQPHLGRAVAGQSQWPREAVTGVDHAQVVGQGLPQDADDAQLALDLGSPHRVEGGRQQRRLDIARRVRHLLQQAEGERKQRVESGEWQLGVGDQGSQVVEEGRGVGGMGRP